LSEYFSLVALWIFISSSGIGKSTLINHLFFMVI